MNCLVPLLLSRLQMDVLNFFSLVANAFKNKGRKHVNPLYTLVTVLGFPERVP